MTAVKECASNPAPERPFARRVIARSTLLLLCLGVLALSAHGETALKGRVTDRTTTLPLAGAAIEVRRGAAVLAHTVSAADGSWLLTFDVGTGAAANNLKLAVSQDGFVDADRDVVVTSGRPDSAVYLSVLVRRSVAECVLKRNRRVVVGYFRPPSATPGTAVASDFAARVTDALLYELSFLERSRLSAELRPSVVACERLDDRENLSALATELKADALMSGSVARSTASSGAAPRYTVSMYLGDPYRLFGSAAPVTSRDVDLDDPSASRLSPTALAAVLQALLKGYLTSEQFAECVEVSGLALAVLPKPAPAAIAELRAECLRRQPVNALLRAP